MTAVEIFTNKFIFYIQYIKQFTLNLYNNTM